ncbi:MAG: extracellular solute-binding protein [Planctomycetota bacterium]|jgi:iron(III) transport system substrate-binding protein
MNALRERRIVAAAWVAVVGIAAGCADDDHLVVYCSVDETFGRMVLQRFEEKTGITVQPVFDSEAGKTTGLVKRIRIEAAEPRADVLFSGEVFHTILLGREGLLEAYESPAARDVPARYKDAQHLWTGIGLRGRVLAFNSQRVAAEQLPRSWEELAEQGHASRLAFANPLFGTTWGHVAAAFALWGEQRGRAFLSALRDGGGKMVDGNSAAVRAVLAGQADLCMTDTDDVRVARRQAASLQQRYLDLGDGGTLLIPSSVAMIKNCPHATEARKLVDFLVSAEVERMLARSDSGNVPVRESLRRELKMELPPSTQLSYDAIADAMEPAAAAVREILIR